MSNDTIRQDDMHYNFKVNFYYKRSFCKNKNFKGMYEGKNHDSGEAHSFLEKLPFLTKVNISIRR